MKMILAIVNDNDSKAVSSAMISEGFQITKLSSSGGILKSGSTTFISGVEDDKVNTAINVIAANSSKRKQLTPNPMTVDMNAYISYPVEVTVGGATVFIWDIEKCIKL